MSNEVENAGSQARDFCMLERNFLSHIKLALLLALLSWSVLLQARLVPEQPQEEHEVGGVPLSAVEYGAALVCILAACWEYYSGYWDLRKAHPFFRGTSLHLMIIGIVAVVVFSTCIVLVIEES
ncbi:hypothetical protein AGABI1DRAFT_111962 [Agaricus bisporus var. burnettii JB137-S8]|uniref:Uncharacterized protein n=1 Tax=Agaricus bisporus var. burnettii (strain JB137-S8 / ATCC MYA-4627 / FGSC 10392) TaxID=597362 RepID=K5Y1L2_AGABU|nr:uncharacterized protein AGABI1DRAFT_111962 [Agaricus bisporus var. burnettii JB137-S8]EKM81695.1 hypothetical protein AGABI1DRAFT_111962 [Agaricus bisporus var. burnettii JB137-S8]